MADFAPNYTFRYRLKYFGSGHDHTLTLRCPRDATADDLGAISGNLHDFLAELQSMIYTDFSFVTADYALADSDVFLPAPLPTAIVPAVSTIDRPESQEALQVSFVGKSTGGHRAVFFLYGVALNPTTSAGALDFRLKGSENANVADAVADLQGAFGEPWCANDGLTVIWYPYMNVKFNDYWTRQVRR